ncbi:MAG: hypothetical protein BWY04_00507 [candidate division CPR1 bacterium ADurb.Bin160]|uniref:Uncharacterized protein n=1 Tax=candidate division CPR1 bacterium ADurb.Bin160 TaxID=1852826 RepID=A0A1V5ZPI2_9BACT|nr:MAG: hypothetical protein BWY04_00507 [candidate division CPR1 bacterium ADurb.Bin160]
MGKKAYRRGDYKSAEKLDIVAKKHVDHLVFYDDALKNYVNNGKISLRICDEPVDETHLKYIDYVYGQISAMSSPDGKTKYKNLKTVVTKGGPPKDKFGAVDRWYFRSIPKAASEARAIIDKIRKDYTQEFGLYLNNAHKMNMPNRRPRFIGWVLTSFDIDCYMIFAVNKYGEITISGETYYINPWTDKLGGSATKGNDGMGIFIYEYPETKQLLMSIRGEHFRDGIEDFEIMKMITKSTQQSNAKIKAAIAQIEKEKNETALRMEKYVDNPDIKNGFVQMQTILKNFK